MFKLKAWHSDYKQKVAAVITARKEFGESISENIKDMLNNPDCEPRQFFAILKNDDFELAYGNETKLLKLVISMVDYWNQEEDFIQLNECWKDVLKMLSSPVMEDWLDRAFDEDGIRELVCAALQGLSSIDLSDCYVQDPENDISDEELITFYEDFLERNSDYYSDLLDLIELEMKERGSDDLVAVEVMKIIEKLRD